MRFTLLRTGIYSVMSMMLLVLMGHHISGAFAHQWLAAGIFLLFAVHMRFHWAWLRNLPRGRYTATRFLKMVITIVTALLAVTLLVSGVLMSPIRYLFAFLPIAEQTDAARTLHHYLSYWFFIMIALHIGTHWKRLRKKLRIDTSRKMQPVVVLFATLIAINGAYAFVRREIYRYVFFINPYSFFDYEEHPLFFFLDYISMLYLFAGVAALASSPQTRQLLTD